MITGTGVGSGLDVASIITSLMTLEKRPLQLLQKRATDMETKISAFGSLKSQIAGLGDIASRLADAAHWNPLKAESSDAAAVTATASSQAAAGKHTLSVSRLAQGQVLTSSASYASSDAVVGTGTLTLEVGTTAGTSFTPAAGSTPVAIVIDSGKQTLAGVRDAINAAGAGVTASIVNGSAGAQLVLRGADGAAKSLRLTVANDSGGDATDTIGLSALAYDPAAPAGGGKNLVEAQVAQDAAFTLDGIALTTPTNRPASVLEGITLDLKKAPAGPVDITVSVDTEALRKSVKEFIDAYNGMNRTFKQQMLADPSGANRGALQGDSGVLSLFNSIKQVLRESVTGAAGSSSLNAAGIEMKADGSLAIDEKRFDPLLANPAALMQLFSNPETGADPQTRGIALRVRDWAKTLTTDHGALATRVQVLQDGIKSNKRQQDTQQDRLARTEARLRAQYQRLDSEMSRLHGQMAQMRNSLGLG